MTRRRRRRTPRGPRVIDVEMSTLVQWTMYDAGMSDPHEMSRALHMVPLSADVEEMERNASTRRLARVEPLADIIATYAAILARLTTATLPDDAVEGVSEAVRATSVVAIVGFLSAFLELGLLHGHYEGAD